MFYHLQPISNEWVGDDEMHVLPIYCSANNIKLLVYGIIPKYKQLLEEKLNINLTIFLMFSHPFIKILPFKNYI